MGCCSIKWLHFNEISQSICTVGLEVYWYYITLQEVYHTIGRNETAFAALYTLFAKSASVGED